MKGADLVSNARYVVSGKLPLVSRALSAGCEADLASVAVSASVSVVIAFASWPIEEVSRWSITVLDRPRLRSILSGQARRSLSVPRLQYVFRVRTSSLPFVKLWIVYGPEETGAAL